MFFKNPVSMLNWVGSGVAILGTYLYSLATDKAKNESKKTGKA
jgi:solute carrier family 35 protein E1